MQLGGSHCEILDNYIHDMMVGVAGTVGKPSADGNSRDYSAVAHNRIAYNKVYHSEYGFVLGGNDWLVEKNEVDRLFMYAQGRKYDDCDYSRFFGRGCIERWRTEKEEWLCRLADNLVPFEEMLIHQNFLLGDRPRFVDFDLYGMLGNFLFSGHYRLPARHVIHTVGPIYVGSPRDPELLAAAVRNSLRLADQHHLKSIAFPAISTGVYGYPKREAARVILSTIVEYCQGTTGIERVIVCLFDRRALTEFSEVLAELNPPVATTP